MKRLNKIPRKLRNYTCIALVVGVLGWSGSGVGDAYYDRAGQASDEPGSGYSFHFRNISNTGTGPASPAPTPASTKREDNQTIINPVEPEPKKPNHSSDSSTTGNNNKPDLPDPIMDLNCDKDADCNKSLPQGAPGYEGFICCLAGGGEGDDDMGRKGQCMTADNCKKKSKSGDDGHKGPEGDGPGGDNLGGTDPQPPSSPMCTSDEQCAKTRDCANENPEFIAEPKCNEEGVCECKIFAPFQCRNQDDCASWAAKRNDTKCPQADWFKCSVSDGANILGECRCEIPAPQCSGKDNGSGCTGCKYNNLDCDDLGGTCSCMNETCKCKLAEQ